MSDDIEIERRLRSIDQKIEENSKILRSIKRKQLFSFWFGITKILIVLGFFYYSYVFIEPFLLQVKEMYQSVQSLSDTTSSFKGFDVFEFLKLQQQQ
jgi:hypothetical protein